MGRNWVIRGAYTRSLGGVGIEQSYRLEPTQVGGLNQAFRSIVPEAVEAANVNAEFETLAAALDIHLPSQIYAGVGGEWYWSELDRQIGAMISPFPGRAPAKWTPSIIPLSIA